jgi:hypothetical protein
MDFQLMNILLQYFSITNFNTMKKLLCSIVVIISSSLVFGQAQDKGEFSFNVNYDGGLHYVEWESVYNGTTTDRDTSGAGTRMLRINAQYNIFKFLSAGLDLRTGSYRENPQENITANGNKVNMWAVSLRLYPVNRDKFVWYFGTTIGGSRLEINRIYTLFSIPAQYKFKSPHFGLETGFNWYFAKNFGMNFGLGYSSQNYAMTEYYLNGDKQDLTNWKNNLLTKGIHTNIGLAFHF